jgi:poly(A)-specific ribonuclease
MGGDKCQKPKIEESKQSEQNPESSNPGLDEAKEKMYQTEMGFALVVEEMIAVNKHRHVPLIGHNCMYDLVYLYNQFVAPLPDSYKEFAAEFHSLFPICFDTKNLATKSQINRTVLGFLYENLKQDKFYKDILGFQFDLDKGFKNYDGSSLEEHYHEAAYDAYMTGLVFGLLMKSQEIRRLINLSKKNNPRGKKGEKDQNPRD